MRIIWLAALFSHIFPTHIHCILYIIYPRNLFKSLGIEKFSTAFRSSEDQNSPLLASLIIMDSCKFSWMVLILTLMFCGAARDSVFNTGSAINSAGYFCPPDGADDVFMDVFGMLPPPFSKNNFPPTLPLGMDLRSLQMHGTTTLSFRFSEGIIVAADSR